MTLKQQYKDTVLPQLHKELGYKSNMAVPRLQKVTLNMGVGAATTDKKILDYAVGDLTKIACQKPVVTLSRRSEAGFKIREGWPIGAKVTLRGDNMFDFLERFITIACPKIRDFRGFTVKSFDGKGNFNIGIKEQIIFNEIRYDQIDTLRGLNISITMKAKSDRDAFKLLKALNFPFRDAFKEETE
jgi:large subunit ribosomal protein L5